MASVNATLLEDAVHLTYTSKWPKADSICDYSIGPGSPRPPLVIDNGNTLRAGWGGEAGPRVEFPSIIARPLNKKLDPSLPTVGNSITFDQYSRWGIKAPLDSGVVVDFEAQEMVFDHAFELLGLNESSVDHPTVLTEPLCCPNESRNGLSELLFECYRVPSVAYGIDGLFSHYYNRPDSAISDGLIISVGYHGSNVMPVVRGRLIAQHSKRLDFGGEKLYNTMGRLLNLRQPSHRKALSYIRIKELVDIHTYFAPNYSEEIDKWESQVYEDAQTKWIQMPLPNTGIDLNDEEEKRKEKEREKELRRELNIKRLQDLHMKRRVEKLQTLQQEKINIEAVLTELKEDEDSNRPVNQEEILASQSRLESIVANMEEIRTKQQASERKGSVTRESKRQRSEVDIKQTDDRQEKLARRIRYNQLRLSTEQIQVPEVLFQPSLIGSKLAGLSEILADVLKSFPETTAKRLASNVFVTGGCALIPGLTERIRNEIRMQHPADFPVVVYQAENMRLDAWKGASRWSSDCSLNEASISRARYQECGGDYLVEHACSNNYFAPVKS